MGFPGAPPFGMGEARGAGRGRGLRIRGARGRGWAPWGLQRGGGAALVPRDAAARPAAPQAAGTGTARRAAARRAAARWRLPRALALVRPHAPPPPRATQAACRR
jgi:hypothetical protein